MLHHCPPKRDAASSALGLMAPAALAFQVMVAAAKENKRRHGARIEMKGHDPTDQDDMIAAVVKAMGLALKTGQRPGE